MAFSYPPNMTERVFIIHGWGGNPLEAWIPWLKKSLESRGCEVHAPAMPDTEAPVMDKWIAALSLEVGTCDSHTHFVGHSIGCQTILRYLQDLPSTTHAGKVALVAPWVHLLESSYEDEEEKEIAQPWLETPLDWESIKQHTAHFFALFSDDDDCVPATDEPIFAQKLGAQTLMLSGYGHFSGGDGIEQLPEVLSYILHSKIPDQ